MILEANDPVELYRFHCRPDRIFPLTLSHYSFGDLHLLIEPDLGYLWLVIIFFPSLAELL